MHFQQVNTEIIFHHSQQSDSGVDLTPRNLNSWDKATLRQTNITALKLIDII